MAEYLSSFLNTEAEWHYFVFGIMLTLIAVCIIVLAGWRP